MLNAPPPFAAQAAPRPFFPQKGGAVCGETCIFAKNFPAGGELLLRSASPVCGSQNIRQMSLAKYESEVKTVAQTQETLFARFSDLTHFSSIKERFADPATQERIAAQVPAGKMEEVRRYIDALEFDADSMRMSSPLGEITLRIVERDEPKCVKFASEGAPVPLYVWVQLLPHGDAASRMRVTVGAEVNVFMRGMVAKPLQQAADGLATLLSTMC